MLFLKEFVEKDDFEKNGSWQNKWKASIMQRVK